MAIIREYPAFNLEESSRMIGEKSNKGKESGVADREKGRRSGSEGLGEPFEEDGFLEADQGMMRQYKDAIKSLEKKIVSKAGTRETEDLWGERDRLKKRLESMEAGRMESAELELRKSALESPEVEAVVEKIDVVRDNLLGKVQKGVGSLFERARKIVSKAGPISKIPQIEDYVGSLAYELDQEAEQRKMKEAREKSSYYIPRLRQEAETRKKELEDRGQQGGGKQKEEKLLDRDLNYEEDSERRLGVFGDEFRESKAEIEELTGYADQITQEIKTLGVELRKAKLLKIRSSGDKEKDASRQIEIISQEIDKKNKILEAVRGEMNTVTERIADLEMKTKARLRGSDFLKIKDDSVSGRGDGVKFKIEQRGRLRQENREEIEELTGYADQITQEIKTLGVELRKAKLLKIRSSGDKEKDASRQIEIISQEIDKKNKILEAVRGEMNTVTERIADLEMKTKARLRGSDFLKIKDDSVSGRGDGVKFKIEQRRRLRQENREEIEELTGYVDQITREIKKLGVELRKAKLLKIRATGHKDKEKDASRQIEVISQEIDKKNKILETVRGEIMVMKDKVKEYGNGIGNFKKEQTGAEPSVVVDPELMREGLGAKNEEKIRELRRGLGLEEMDDRVVKTKAVVKDLAEKFARESKEEIKDPEIAKKEAMNESYSKYKQLKEEEGRREYSGESPDMYVSFSAEKYKNTTDQMNTELARLDEIDEETDQQRESLGRVGFFNFSEKKRIKDEMKDLAQEKRGIKVELNELDREISAMNSEITKKTGKKSFWDIDIREIGKSHRKFQKLSNEGGDSAENYLSFSYDQHREVENAIKMTREQIKSARGWTASSKRRQLSKKLDYFEGKLAKMDNEYDKKVIGSQRSTQRRLSGGREERVAIVRR